VLCERAGDILVLVPKLDGNHFPPGFTAAFNERPLGDPNRLARYATYSQSTRYKLDVKRGDGHDVKGAMQLRPDRQPLQNEQLELYRETGKSDTCEKFDTGVASV